MLMSSRVKAAAVTISIIGMGMFAIALLSGLLYEQAERARDRNQHRERR